MKVSDFKIKKPLILVFVYSFLILTASVSYSGDKFAIKKSKPNKFVVEYVYNFIEKTYENEYVLKPIEKTELSRISPEESFISHFSAMVKKDYKWWLSGWDSDSQKSIAERNVAKNRSEDDWIRIWENAMKDQSIKIVKRVDTGTYVFIVYKMFDKNNKQTFGSIYVCKKVNNEWLATEELAGDLMFQHYLEGKLKVTLNIR